MVGYHIFICLGGIEVSRRVEEMSTGMHLPFPCAVLLWPHSNLHVCLFPSDKLFYVYTSGTTGLPKAAIVVNSR